MSSDHYSILGVSPSAQDVVIRAAYRALIRHYHPDSNPDPEAQKRVREINAAFEVLRDPAKRADYDAERAGSTLWRGDEIAADRARPPAMRTVGLASVGLALALVIAVWARPQPDPPRERISPTARHAPARKPQPIVELEPETERLARLRGDSDVAPPVPDIDRLEAVARPPAAMIAAPRVEPFRVAQPTAPRRALVQVAHRPAPDRPSAAASPKPRTQPAPAEASAGCRPGETVVVSAGCKNDRVATLDRMAASFFSQSMAHADAAKKQLLLTSHTRSAETRGACHSDSCLTEAYLRQMREISAIMEGRPVPAQ